MTHLPSPFGINTEGHAWSTRNPESPLAIPKGTGKAEAEHRAHELPLAGLPFGYYMNPTAYMMYLKRHGSPPVTLSPESLDVQV
jgi:hypothetical protein